MAPSIPEASNPPELDAGMVVGEESKTSDHFPAMTTQWNVPNSCTWTYNAASEPKQGATGAVAWLDLEPDVGATTLSCYPDGMFVGGRTGVFSPATCPSGWTTATVVVNTDEAPDEATTTAICCSSEYSLDDTICKRSVPTVLAVPISYNATASTHDVLSSSTTTLYSATIAVYTIMAMFRDSDKSMLGIGDEDDIDDEYHGSGLTINAKIGIGVGAAIAGLLIIGGIVLLCLRVRHRDDGRNSHEMGSVREGCGHGEASRRDGASVISTEGSASVRCPYGLNGEPPPAYQASTGADSLSDDASGNGAPREQIEYLRAQKELIQRRIEELENVEPDDNEAQAHRAGSQEPYAEDQHRTGAGQRG